jgi:hypothetical protein
MLNKMANDAAQARPGLGAYLLLQAAQRAQGRHTRQLNKAHDKLMAEGKLEGGGEWLDRLHPKRVADPDGGMAADARTRKDHWNGKGEETVSIEKMRSLIAQAALSRYFSD